MSVPKRLTSLPLVVATVVATALLLATACGDTSAGNPRGERDTGTGDTGTAGDTGEPGDTGDTGVGDDTAGDDTSGGDTTATDTSDADTGDLGPDDIASYRIEPAAATLALRPGEQPTQRFTLFAIHGDGSELELSAEGWTATPATLGAITPGGTFTASGVSGGTVQVQASHGGQVVASTLLELQMTLVDTGGLDPTLADLFPPSGTESTDAAQRPTLVYPYAETVFPSGMYPPVLQWSDPYGGAAAALFRIVLERGPVRVEVLTDGSGVPECPTNTASGRCYQLSVAQWRVLAEAGAAETVRIQLWGRPDQTPGNPSYVAEPVAVRLVPADLTGKVYYYYVSNGAGAIQQIDIALDEAQRPTNTRVLTNESRCHGCHALSRDGRRLATEVSVDPWPEWESAVLDLDDAGDASQWIATPDDGKDWKGVAYAFNPDGSKLLGAYVESDLGNRQRLMLYDLDTLGAQQVLEDATHPGWSPDGGLVAYTRIVALGGEGQDPRIDVAQSDLVRMTAAEGADGSMTWGSPEVLVPGGGAAVSWPTFSPDSARIAFSQGELARLSEHNSGVLKANSLYLIDSTAAPGTAPVHLARASRAVGPGGERYDLQPVFSPFLTSSTDGNEQFYWMLFQSVRPYGVVNPNLGRHQLWVAAVTARELVSGGADPSHPAFYLPGQATDTNNVMGFWAADPCGKTHPDGSADSCTLTSECCAGYVCNASGTCEQQEEQCGAQGQSCETSADCCSPLTCAVNTAGDLVCQQIFN